ncbi:MULTISPECIES: DUF1924 domain-containing protein [unclassified Burkholderia]|uniref:DUF1924 domain-containing protein n=1 Tax=unclassified Burkholderia TaxID=2613784 RepID=UPI002013992B|nr:MULTISPECIES: DUF1924 domain-containing protein [unclassified Burkholderia]
MLCRAWLAAAICAAAIADASAETPAQLLAGYTVQSGVGAVPSRGQQFFTSRHGRDWSCATCHGSTPTGAGRHVVTGKAIEPLAPAFNPARFSDGARTEKWFRRNCKDVVGRECSAIEKADVLSWLMSLKP